MQGIEWDLVKMPIIVSRCIFVYIIPGAPLSSPRKKC